MKVGLHFHGKLERVTARTADNKLLIVMKADEGIIESLDKMDLLGRSEGKEIEVTIASD